MALVFHERVGQGGRRISPFSWRIRYAFAHKGLDPEIVPTRFADVDRIRSLSGQHYVPIIEHDGEVVHDSWSIACHLEERFPDRSSLFGGDAGRGAARLVSIWSDSALGSAMRRQIYGDFVWVIDPGDRAYFRYSRETLLGATLEDYSADRDEHLPAFFEACVPLERALLERPYLAGATPAYIDYVVFSVFQWARVGCPRDILANGAGMAGVRAWRARMVALYDHLGDRFPLFPSQRSGPDGRTTSEDQADCSTAPSLPAHSHFADDNAS